MWLRVPLLIASFAACGRVGFDFGGGVGDDTASDARADDTVTTDGGPMLDCTMTHPTAMFCDGFEAPGMGGWDYTITDFGSATRTTAMSYRGGASLESVIQSDNDYKAARWGLNYGFPSLASGDLYARGYYRFASGDVVTDQVSVLVVGNAEPPYPATYVLLTPGQIHSVGGPQTNAVSLSLPLDRWVCLELHVAIGAAGFVEVFMEGTRMTVSPVGDTRVAGGYTNLDVGVHYATPQQQQMQLWVDEVVADTSPIGCN